MAYALTQPTLYSTLLRPLAGFVHRLKTLTQAEPVPYWTDYLNARD